MKTDERSFGLGMKLNKEMKAKKVNHYRSWLVKAPVGLATIGFGACLIAEAAMLKYSGAMPWEWIAYGTLALVVFNAGLCVFGDAIIHRVHYEREKKDG